MDRLLAANRSLCLLAWMLLAGSVVESAHADDPLPSWNDGPAKQAIVAFVQQVTGEGDPSYVPPPRRIAAFDNDGTLWVEQPMYTQLVFAVDRVKRLAPSHPEWRTYDPFKAVLAGNLQGAAASGEKGAFELIIASHAGLSTRQFGDVVSQWLAESRHPRFKRRYTECVYQPMIEVLEYLRANQFKTFIVSGGGVDFMRPWTEQAYGIPPEQVVGSAADVRYEQVEGKPTLVRLPDGYFVDDGPGKPKGIERFIGRRPILAFGNSDGDFEMLKWTTAGSGPRLGLLVHHTDAKREYAYDRHSNIGQLARGLDEAPKEGWIVVDMKNDWKRVFDFTE